MKGAAPRSACTPFPVALGLTLPPQDASKSGGCLNRLNVLTTSSAKSHPQVTNERSTVLIVNELRSQTVHALFHEIFLTTFTIKTVPHAKMDPVYQHPAIEIFVLKRRKAGRGGGGSGAAAPAAAAPADGSVPPGNADDDDTEATAEATASSLAAAVVEAGSCRGEGASAGAATVSGASTLPAAVADDEEALTRQMAGLATNDGSKNSGGADSGAEGTHGPPQQPQLRDDPSSSLSSDWQTRRAGAMAARLLADVKVPQQSQGPR